jgi:hypothetical protein
MIAARVPARGRPARWALFLVLLLTGAAGCGGDPFTLSAAGPWTYTTASDAPFERVAVLVTITNRSGDDLAVNPADFLVRDGSHRVYPADPTAAAADARAVQLAYGARHGVQGIAPLPVVTLRQDDVLTGFVVFTVPTGARLVELIWRQTDSDTVVPLAPAG